MAEKNPPTPLLSAQLIDGTAKGFTYRFDSSEDGGFVIHIFPPGGGRGIRCAFSADELSKYGMDTILISMQCELERTARTIIPHQFKAA